MYRAAIACCCLLAAAVQARVVAVSPTPSADTVRYVRVAQRMSSEGPLAGLRGSDEHPLYPLLVAGAESAARASALALDWVDAAQLVSATFAIVAVPLAWLAFRSCSDERAALAAALAFTLWPMTARAGADALADSLQWAMVAAAWACLTSGETTRAAWAGLALGVAALARSEAWVVASALGIMELAIPLDDRRGWTARGSRLAALGLGLIAPAALLVALSQPTGPADAAARLLGRPRSGITHSQAPRESGESLIPLKERSISSRFHGALPASRAFTREIGNAGSWLWLPLAIGIGVWLRQPNAMGRGTAQRRALAQAAIYSAVVVVTASRLGYLTERHVWLTLFFLFPWVGQGVVSTAEWLMQAAHLASLRLWAPRGAVGLALGAALALATWKAAQPVHLSRANHRQAADWLSANSRPGAVLDTRGWTALYSGRTTYSVDRAADAVRDPRLAFVVVEARELAPENLRSSALRELLTAGAELAVRCVSPRDAGAAVLVYRWHPERYAARRGEAALASLGPKRDA